MIRNTSSSNQPRFQSSEICESSSSNLWKKAGIAVAMIAGLFVLSGCELRRAMYDQPKIARPLQAAPDNFWADGRASRPNVEGAVQWSAGEYTEDLLLTDGKENGVDATRFPFAISATDLARGKERFEIYCSPCHDRAGTGNGMIVKRGFKQPPSYHQDRLRTAAPGYFYNVVKNGFGQMQGYAPQIPVDDRWRIVAYIRALQFSQNADPKDLPKELAAQLK
jgi:mono/diheme cytochrome c family protein